MPKAVFQERAELIVWRDDQWRCELWIVNGTPRLRLFLKGAIVRDFGVDSARQALDLGASWKTTAAAYQSPIPY